MLPPQTRQRDYRGGNEGRRNNGELSRILYEYLVKNDGESLSIIYRELFEHRRRPSIEQSQARKILDLFKELKEGTKDGENVLNTFRNNIIKILVFFEYQIKRGIIDGGDPFIKALKEVTKKILDDLSRNEITQSNIKDIAERYSILAEMFVAANYKKK